MNFDWKSLGEILAKLGLPILGTALAGPAGAAIGGALANAVFPGAPEAAQKSTPETLAALLTGSTDALRAAKEFELREKSMLLEHCLAMAKEETKRVEAVNATMQSESKSEHWAQWLWRPFNGFVLGTLVFCDYFLLPLLKIPVPTIPTEVWLALGAVVGVTAWHRGREQLAETLGDKWGADKK
jgi:hypothetical protein